jgi:hypothetical protein
MGYLGRTPTPSPIDSSDIPANSIDASKIVDGSIELAEIADNSITDAKLNSSKLDGIETGATNYIHPTTHATADIADNAITEAKIADAAVVSLKSGRKNLIINGDTEINQRALISGTPTNVGNNTYTCDRWVTVQSVAANTSTVTGNDNNTAIRMTIITSTSAQACHEQRIENPSRYDGKTVTFSCMVKSDSNLVRLNVYDSGWNGITSNVHTGGGAWEKLTVTATLSVSQTDLRMRIGFSDGGNVNVVAGTYFDFTQAQLELGSVATDFEHRSYGEELALCQRYYQDLCHGSADGSLATATYYITNAVYGVANLVVEMRTVPTVTCPDATDFRVFSNGGGIPTNTFSAGTVNPKSVEVRFGTLYSGVQGHGCFVRQNIAGASIQCDAEL